jgi:hypothetical protein
MDDLEVGDGPEQTLSVVKVVERVGISRGC